MMIPAIDPTGHAQKAAWASRVLPPVEEVSHRVWSIPVPCEGFSIRYTLAYAIANDLGDFVLVDPGFRTRTGDAALRDGISQAGLTLERLAGVVVTHHHPDHIALADIAPSGAWLGMHPAEARYLAQRPGGEEWFTGEETWLRSVGVPDDALDSVRSTTQELDAHHITLTADLLLEDHALIPLEGRTIRTVWTPGHTVGHICLAIEDAGLLLTGDHLLPRISPNVGVHWLDAQRDSVGEYLSSLTRLLAWEAYEVCPAHEYRFRGIAARVKQLTAHQSDRSAEVAQRLAEHREATAWQIAGMLHWSRTWDSLDSLNRRAALGETVAHLIHLGTASATR